MYSGAAGSTSATVDGHSVRRSMRVAQLTPSKLGEFTLPSDADSDATVRPLRLLGTNAAGGSQQRGRSRSPSRRSSRSGTPSKTNAAGGKSKTTQHTVNNEAYSHLLIPRGQLPLRLDTPNPGGAVPSSTLLDSRTKHARALDHYDHSEETPIKAFPEWPSDSLVTPIINAQQARRNQMQQQAAMEETVQKVKPPQALLTTGGTSTTTGGGGIFLSESVRARRKPNAQVRFDPKFAVSLVILCFGFFVTLFYHGEILEYLVEAYGKINLKQAWSTNQDQNWRRDLAVVFEDLQVLRRDLSAMPQVDLSRLLDRLEQMESREASQEALLLGLKQRLVGHEAALGRSAAEQEATRKKIWDTVEDLGNIQSTLQTLKANEDQYEKAMRAFAKRLDAFAADWRGPEDLLTGVLAKVKEYLPTALLARRSPDGQIVLDPAFYEYLQDQFGQTIGTDTGAVVDGQVSLKAAENLVKDRLEDFERRIVLRDEIIALVKREIDGNNKESLDIAELEARLAERFSQHRDEATARATPKKASLLPNFASDAAGAKPLIALSSSSYYPGSNNSWKQWLRGVLAIGPPAKPHRTALSPDNSFGNCWAFPGSEGHLTLELTAPVVPKKASICHIGSEMVSDRSSAPRQIQIWAIPSIMADPQEYELVGEFEYSLEGDACQYFILSPPSRPTRHFQVRIASNHGRPAFTCLYQVGLHAIPQ